MNDPKADKAETKPLVKISNKVIEIEEYESVMRQSRKVLTRMDEVLDNSTNTVSYTHLTLPTTPYV